MSCSGSMSSISKEVSDCLNGWLSYLQMMNGLCTTGSRLSRALNAAVEDKSSPCYGIASQCCAVWEELVKSTALATSSIKAQVLTSFQDISSNNLDSDIHSSHKINQQIICSSLMTFINLQYRFSIMCCEFLGSMANTNCCQSNEIAMGNHEPDCCVRIIEQCFSSVGAPIASPQTIGFHHITRNPLYFLSSSCEGPQRRWSEAAAGEVSGESVESTVRRWSMPWESSRRSEHRSNLHPQFNPIMKLAVPCVHSQDRSQSTTPDSVWHNGLASQEELQEVIHLLSCRPRFGSTSQTHHSSQHLSGAAANVTTQCFCDSCSRLKSSHGYEECFPAFPGTYSTGSQGVRIASHVRGDICSHLYSSSKEHGRIPLRPNIEEPSREVHFRILSKSDGGTSGYVESTGNSVTVDHLNSSSSSLLPT